MSKNIIWFSDLKEKLKNDYYLFIKKRDNENNVYMRHFYEGYICYISELATYLFPNENVLEVHL